MKPLVVYNPGMELWYVVCSCVRVPRWGFLSAASAGDYARQVHHHVAPEQLPLRLIR